MKNKNKLEKLVKDRIEQARISFDPHIKELQEYIYKTGTEPKVSAGGLGRLVNHENR